MKETGFLLFRLAMGANMFFHSINRFYYGPSAFKDWMVTEFETTFIPSIATSIFAYVLPYLEGLVGISLLLGIRTKLGLIVGSIIITFLIIGSCLINKWDWVGLQMVYAICFYLMFEKYEQNTISIDKLLRIKQL
ncbi:MAG: DoxX family membrane protein [Xanthomarina gelatinilytica]|uniref:DoxX family membrane protein n=1 Tax=Xanthomarina gelatinilytica TaxID=1137281 RepID=UPI003A8B8661